MENENGPGDHKNNAEPAGGYHVSLSDMEPVRGITDCLDDVIFGLCDTSHTEILCSANTDKQTAPANGYLQFCQHLRLTTNADTVYLCERQSLRVTSTTSIGFTEDTDDMHRALTSAISNLSDCSKAFQLPAVRVFEDNAKLSFTVMPVSMPVTAADLQLQASLNTRAEYLAIIVDADEEYQQPNAYITQAVQAIFTSITADSKVPDNRQIQRAVFDQLKRNCGICSDRITTRRHDIFFEDLRHVTVHFEKLLAPDAISNNAINSPAITDTHVTEAPADPLVWGWQSVASLIEDDQYPHALYQQAELWGETFTTGLDTHILREAAFRYKEVCEAANLNSFEMIKPLCIKAYMQSLLQDSYLDTLQELLEMAVIRGEQVVLELSEKTRVGNAATETAADLNCYKKHLHSCYDRFGVQFGLSEFGTGHSSLLRASTLSPDVIKLSASLLPDRHSVEESSEDSAKDEWADNVSRLAASTRAADSESNKLKPAQILIDASQLPSTNADDMQSLFEKPGLDTAKVTQRQSLAA